MPTESIRKAHLILQLIRSKGYLVNVIQDDFGVYHLNANNGDHKQSRLSGPDLYVVAQELATILGIHHAA